MDCNSDTSSGGCKEDPLAFAASQFESSQKKKRVIGIAKDGHLILGPFDDNGNAW